MPSFWDSALAETSAVKGDRHTWPDTLSQFFVELEFEALGKKRQPLNGAIYKRPFGDLVFHRAVTEGCPHRVTRSDRLIRQSTHNNFFIGLLLSGGITLRQDGRTAALNPGDIAILDSTRFYCIDVPHERFDALWITTPRFCLEGRLSNITGSMASRVDGYAGAGHIASQMLRAAFSQSAQLSPTQANRIANNILDMLSLSLQDQDRPRPAHGSSYRAAILRRVQRYIEARLDDETLTAQTVAQAHQLSARYLNKLFEDEGMSVARWIRMRRLERCRAEIESQSSLSRSMTEIALSHGFKNVSHFNRLFRSRFGCAPTTYRRTHLQQPPAAAAFADCETGGQEGNEPAETDATRRARL